jgi:hypothetical protein
MELGGLHHVTELLGEGLTASTVGGDGANSGSRGVVARCGEIPHRVILAVALACESHTSVLRRVLENEAVHYGGARAPGGGGGGGGIGAPCAWPPCDDTMSLDGGGGGFTPGPPLSWTRSPPWLEDSSGFRWVRGERAQGPDSVAPAIA